MAPPSNRKQANASKSSPYPKRRPGAAANSKYSERMPGSRAKPKVQPESESESESDEDEEEEDEDDKEDEEEESYYYTYVTPPSSSSPPGAPPPVATALSKKPAASGMSEKEKIAKGQERIKKAQKQAREWQMVESLRSLANEEERPQIKFATDRLGKGHFGTVEIGVLPDGREVAVKVIDTKPKPGAHLSGYLVLEINFLKKLKHPNVVKFINAYFKTDALYIVMEYINGWTLWHIVTIQIDGYFPGPFISSMSRQLFTGLAYIHQNGIIHRDLKSNNTVLRYDGTLKIIDFGCACEPRENLNEPCGARRWRAPEVVRKENYSYPVDVYGAGCILLHIVDKSPPYGTMGPVTYEGMQKRLQSPMITTEMLKKYRNFVYHFVKTALTADQTKRWTAAQLLTHPCVNHAIPPEQKWMRKFMPTFIKQIKEKEAERKAAGLVEH